MRRLLLLLPFGLASCTTGSTQSVANFVAGTQTACVNTQTGLILVEAFDPAFANAKQVQHTSNGCAAIEALPVPGAVPPAVLAPVVGPATPSSVTP